MDILTFYKVLSFGNGVPHKGKKEHAEYSGNVVDLVKSLKQKEGKDIYCDGGAEIVFELLNNSLVNRVIVSVIPHLPGDGIRLFKDANVELHYIQNGKPSQNGYVERFNRSCREGVLDCHAFESME